MLRMAATAMGHGSAMDTAPGGEAGRDLLLPGAVLGVDLARAAAGSRTGDGRLDPEDISAQEVLIAALIQPVSLVEQSAAKGVQSSWSS